MARTRKNELLERDDHVVAAAAAGIPYVPTGTRGRIKLVNGFAWKRYWVRFDNGVDVGSLDRTQLTLVDSSGEPVEIA